MPESTDRHENKIRRSIVSIAVTRTEIMPKEKETKNQWQLINLACIEKEAELFPKNV